MPKKLKLLSLFSGAGGLDLGFESSGLYESIACVEANKIYADTLRLNRGLQIKDGCFLKNSLILNCTVKYFADEHLIKIIQGGIDGIIGGPPCQPFSTIGKRLGMSDPRATTLWDYAKVVEAVKPKFFLFENVPNLAWQWRGRVLSDLIDALAADGQYKIEWKIVNLADYGAFTKRRRLVVIGIRVDCLREGRDPIIPFPSHAKSSLALEYGIDNWKTVADALKGLRTANPSRADFPTHHVAVKHSEEIVQRFQQLKPGEQDKKRKRWRLDNDQPSNSLMAGGEGGFVFHMHPYLPRELTSRECARIQGFPDHFNFSGKPLDVAKQIVNAVPIQFGCSIATSILKSLKKMNI